MVFFFQDWARGHCITSCYYSPQHHHPTPPPPLSTRVGVVLENQLLKALATTIALARMFPAIWGDCLKLYETRERKLSYIQLSVASRESEPQCECPASRRGARCEVDPCDNFCLSHSVACRLLIYTWLCGCVLLWICPFFLFPAVTWSFFCI